ncbi:MAG: glycosyltransferase family 2 protein [Saprospiraceae bacterium]|jgi:glycosyltransferase involved in cell wall biosynthesis|nr:glycosyltransferase family 2 protein [Saprospiraceae bacterium]
MDPKITIVIPVYNRLELLKETLSSVKEQSESNWESILVDDGSNEDTVRYLEEIVRNDARFRFIRNLSPRKGGSVCRNIGYLQSSSQYVFFLDSDDILPPTCLSSRLSFIVQHPEADYWVFDTLHFFNTPGDSTLKWNMLDKETDDLTRFLLQDNPWHTSGPVWSRKALDALQGYDEKAVCWQDWEFHVRAVMAPLRYKKCGDIAAAGLYRKDLHSSFPSITADRNRNKGAQWSVFQNIISVLNLSKITSSQKKAISVGIYRLFEDAVSTQDHKTANEIFRFKNLNLFFSITERFALYFVLRLPANVGATVWIKRKIRRILQRINASVFLNTESQTYIYHKLLFPEKA